MCSGGGKARRRAQRAAERARQRAAAEQQRIQADADRRLRTAMNSMAQMAQRPTMPEAPPPPARAPEPLMGPQGQTAAKVRQRRRAKGNVASRRSGSGGLKISMNVPSVSYRGGVNV